MGCTSSTSAPARAYSPSPQRARRGDGEYARAGAEVEDVQPIFPHPEVLGARAPSLEGRGPSAVACILRGRLRRRLRMRIRCWVVLLAQSLAHRIQRQQTAARGAVMAGTEDERRIDLDADAAGRDAGAI